MAFSDQEAHVMFLAESTHPFDSVRNGHPRSDRELDLLMRVASMLKPDNAKHKAINERREQHIRN